MFWKKKVKNPTNKTAVLNTIEDGIRFAMEHGISVSDYMNTTDPFRWKSDYESVESQLKRLSDLAVKFRKQSREYAILYPGGADYNFNVRLTQFVADENFKKKILNETIEREVEVQRSRAMVEAVRAGKDTHPQFLALVDAKSLDDIRQAESILKRA